MSDFEEFVYRFDVRPAHIDVFGHMNNAKYLEILEEARWDLLENRGFGLAYIRESSIGPVVLDAKIQFKKELKVRDRCEIRTVMLDYSGKIGRIQQKLFLLDGKLACAAEFTIGLFDLEARKLIAPSPKWLNAIGIPTNILK